MVHLGLIVLAMAVVVGVGGAGHRAHADVPAGDLRRAADAVGGLAFQMLADVGIDRAAAFVGEVGGFDAFSRERSDLVIVARATGVFVGHGALLFGGECNGRTFDWRA